MYSDRIIFLFLTLCGISIKVQSFVQLPFEGNNDTRYTEAIIRDKINNIFTNLRVKTKPTSQDDNIIHNFIVSMTPKDFNKLKEIERLSRVYALNKGRNFIPEINDVLNAKDESEVLTETVYTAEPFINELRHLKKIYQLQNTEKNPRTLNHIVSIESTMDYSNETIISDNPFWVPKADRRLYHGHRGNIKLFPFMAIVMIYEAFRCAGTIIKIDAAITSATCFDGFEYHQENHDITLLLAANSNEHNLGDRVYITDLYRHPRYNPKTLMHNIALLKLDEHEVDAYIKPYGSHVQRILLDTRPTPLTDRRAKILVVGWGSKSYNDHGMHGISYSVLNLHPKSSCEKYYTTRHVTKYNFCASLYPKKGGACRHDIGGPGIINGKLVGIISFASRICGNSPTVFTKVGYYTKWMEDVLGPGSAYIFKSPKFQKRIIRNMSDPSRYRTDRTTQSVKIAKNDGFGDVYRGFQDFISGIFSRAQDDTASKEDVINDTNVIKTLA